MRNSFGTAITLRYGQSDSQVGDLYLPINTPSPVLCLLHGGFWRYPYGKDQMDEISLDLVNRGFAVWNIEYRRVGESGGGWPGTLSDVFSAIDFLAGPSCKGYPLDLSKVIVIGHSAGGHLALLSCLKQRPLELHQSSAKVLPIAAAVLAGVTDLNKAYDLNLGNGAVEALLGGSPACFPERFLSASPIRQLPFSVRQLVLHGVNDEALPLELSEHYAEAARQFGDDVTYKVLPNTGHMEFLDSTSPAHNILGEWLNETLLKS